MTKKIYIFSGPDRVGKSSFCNSLKNHLSINQKTKKIHLIKPQNVLKPFEDIEYYVQNDLKENDNLIFDRGWPCRLFYNQSSLDRNKGIDLEIKFLEMEIKCYHIYIYREPYFSAPLLMKEMKEKCFYDAERFKYYMDLHYKYNEWIRDYFKFFTLYPWLICSPSKYNSEECIELIKELELL